MQRAKKLVKSYFNDDNAIDDSIMKIIFFVGAIAIAGAIIYFGYNTISGQADKATDKLDNLTNPGAGNEFSANPF